MGNTNNIIHNRKYNNIHRTRHKIFRIRHIIPAKTNSIKEAFNFKNIYTEFKQKGAKILIGIIIICIISTILGMIFALLNTSFSSGIIISIIGYAYLTILNYRFIGLLYNS